MDLQQHDQNAEDRFRQRSAQRAAQLDKVAKGIIDFNEIIRRDPQDSA